MAKPMKNSDLTKILSPYTKDKLWVVLSSDRKKVVGKGATLKEALREAKSKKVRNPVAIKAIPDSSGFVL